MAKSKIGWCDCTINPVVGCSKCSPACDNCYAERQAARLVHMPQTAKKYAGVVDGQGKWTGVTNFDVACLTRLPKTPKRIFVGSMCDLFHDSVTDAQLEYIMGHIGLTSANAHHIFMLLTKRPKRMRDFFTSWKPYREMPNLWLGVTVCNQQEADEKIPLLLATPAAKRFASIEPILGAINLQDVYPHDWMHCKVCGWYGPDDGQNGADHKGNEEDGFESICPKCGNDGYAGEFDWTRECAEAYQETILPGLDWVICGGETGPKARPMHPDWVRGLRDQCSAAAISFLFKGWGEWWPAERGRLYREETLSYTDGQDMVRTGMARAGRLLDGVEYCEVPHGR